MTATHLAERDAYVLREIGTRRLPCVLSLAGGYSSDAIDLHLQTLRIAASLD